jgi:hypothetical protein
MIAAEIGVAINLGVLAALEGSGALGGNCSAISGPRRAAVKKE